MSKIDCVIKEISFKWIVNYNNEKIIFLLLFNVLHNQINLRAKDICIVIYILYIFYILYSFKTPNSYLHSISYSQTPWESLSSPTLFLSLHFFFALHFEKYPKNVYRKKSKDLRDGLGLWVSALCLCVC